MACAISPSHSISTSLLLSSCTHNNYYKSRLFGFPVHRQANTPGSRTPKRFHSLNGFLLTSVWIESTQQLLHPYLCLVSCNVMQLTLHGKHQVDRLTPTPFLSVCSDHRTCRFEVKRVTLRLFLSIQQRAPAGLLHHKVQEMMWLKNNGGACVIPWIHPRH